MFLEIWSPTEFFLILGHFLPFYPLNNPENLNFEKMKQEPGNIISHKLTINDNHIMYYSCDMKRNTEFFIILGYFLPFYLPNSPKIKMKKPPGNIIILQ